MLEKRFAENKPEKVLLSFLYKYFRIKYYIIKIFLGVHIKCKEEL